MVAKGTGRCYVPAPARSSALALRRAQKLVQLSAMKVGQLHQAFQRCSGGDHDEVLAITDRHTKLDIVGLTDVLRSIHQHGIAILADGHDPLPPLESQTFIGDLHQLTARRGGGIHVQFVNADTGLFHRTERMVQAFPFRYFFRYEVEHLLARAGFEITDIFGNFDKSPLTDDSPEMIFVAEMRC